MKIGNANYSGGSKKRNYFKLSEGESVFRIMPPMGENAETGKWANYYSVHWGYKNEENRQRLFMSPEITNRNNRMIEVEDPAKERIKALKAKQEELRASGNIDGSKKISSILKQYNLDNKWHVNAMTLDGKIGLLKIPHKAKQALDQAIKELIARGVDPLAVTGGRYFVFKRIGMGLDTLHQVSVYKEKMNVAGVGEVEKELESNLTQDVLSRLSTEAVELNKLYDRPTAEQVRQIVAADLAGDKSQVDRLLGRDKGNSDEGPGEDDEQETAAPAAATSTQAAAPQAVATPAPKAAAPAPAPTLSAGAPAAQSKPADQMSDAEFLKSLGM